MAMPEAEMERRLIEQLCHDVSQWTYRPDLKTEADLWNNLRDKLNRNNLALLDGMPLTGSEMEQVKEFIREQSETTYKAARWLAGEHRIAQIPVVREDASRGTVSLMAINNREIAGGHSSYEIINQYRSTVEESGGTRDRRFDVTLLINGLPLIHIELKNHDHPFMDAYRQIKKYGGEGKFRGLMGLVQMFVVSNGVQTRYIAANNQGDLNEKFLTGWTNENNEPVEDYIAFAKAALNIPAAHLMVGKYSVLDNERRKVILLRPYQIHAIEAIRKASRERNSGFIWHTTGSGKTLTSYTVTKNLLDIPSVDKTVFLIDRRDLDQQTSATFMSYAESDDIDVQNTEHTVALEKKLASRDRCAIVTTVQKLQTIIRRCTDETAVKALRPEQQQKYAALADQLRTKNIAFVVDECHRAVTPETKRQLDRFFSRSLWYGFTGTPIFAENKRAQKGNLARTTQELYGDCLHKYTIKDAIHDDAVLGFQIQSMGQTPDQFRELAVQLHLYEEPEVSEILAEDLEREIISAFKRLNKRDFYDTDEHRNEVIDYIINRSAAKFRLNAGSGQSYEGLLTVSSIEEAQHYYELFKQFREEGRIEEKIRRLLPDFPRVAITYTVGENEEGATADQKKMAASLEDYNAMFGTNWDLSTLGAYNAELNERLARKKSKYLNRVEQLDLVIVVDRLLTGFDAPCMSAIFLDRPPMKPQHLIQAFSRTNRLFDRSKRYGQVVTMQTPALYSRLIDDALVLYCDGGAGVASAPTYKETRKNLEHALKRLRKIASTPEEAKELRGKEEMSRFAKSFQLVDRFLDEIGVYDEFSESLLTEELKFSRELFDEFEGVYQNVIEELRHFKPEPGPEPEPVPELDIEYELFTVKSVEIDYRYLVSLIQKHMTAPDENPAQISEADDQQISEYITQYSKANPQLGRILSQFWFEVKWKPEEFRNKDAHTLIGERINTALDEAVSRFAGKWKVSPEALKSFALTTPSTEIDAAKINTDMGDYRAYKEAGGSGSKLVYLKELRQAAADFIRQELKPLLHT